MELVCTLHAFGHFPRKNLLLLSPHRLSRSVAVLDGALRFGCVNLQVDVYQPHSSSSSREGAGGVHHLSADADQAQRDALFRGCIPEVVAQWMATTQLAEHLEAGTVMTVQVLEEGGACGRTLQTVGLVCSP